MFKIDDDMTINVTRGDCGTIDVSAIVDGAVYVFLPGDILRLKVFEKKNCENVVLKKDYGIEVNATTVTLTLTGKDTKFGGIINKPTNYWYEIELNPETNPQTIVGYDDEGPKLFCLHPEGNEVDEIEPDEEDIGVFDDKLDLTSNKPLPNWLIAKEILQIQNNMKKIDAKVISVGEFGATGDGKTDDTDVIQSAIDTANTIYFPSGTYMVNSTGLKLHNDMRIILDADTIIQRITDNAKKKPLIHASGCENITIEGGKIYGDILSHDISNLGSVEYQNHGVAIRECTNVTIKNCEIAYHLGDSVMIGSAPSWNENNKASEKVYIENCILHDSHRHGITFGGVDNATVRNTEIFGIKWLDDIDFESNWSDDVPNTNIEIIGCNFHSPDTQIYSQYYGVMNNDCSNLIIKDSHLHTVAAKKNTNIFNCTVDTIQIYENVSSIIEGCIIRCLTPCSSSNIIAVRNCLFKAEDDESSVNIAQIRSSSDVTLDINFYNCKIITPKSKSNVFVSTDYALRYALDSCELIIRNGKAIMPKGKNSQIVNCSVFLWNDEIEKSTRAIETVDGVENLEIINNVIYAGDIVQDYAKAGALIYLGGGNVQVINNILATKSAVGVTNGAPIRFKVSVATAYVIGNALPLYSMAYTINDGGVTTVKSANNILSGDLAT